MSIKILMPALSPTMKDGTIQKWLVKEGDQIKAGDILAEIETDKATMEVEAVDEGKVTKILIKEGSQNVPINSVIAILNGSDDEESEKDLTKSPEISSEANTKKNKIKNNEYANKNTEFNKYQVSTEQKKIIFASPFAKKLAKDKKIDLNLVKGSGPEGRIIKRDFEVIKDEDNLSNSVSNLEFIEPTSIRKIIAEKTTKTKNSVPHFYLTIESKVDKLLKLRKIINEERNEIKVSINDILVKCLAIAQKNNPKTNASWINGKIINYNSIDVSVAIALEEGLVTPVVKNADKKGLLEISNEIKLFAKKAKHGHLTPEEYTGGTISISNLGMYGINEFAAIINPPQSCILAVGSINKIPKIIDNNIEEISTLKSTLSADHRILDGAIAAKLLKDFNDIIENPYNLWLQSNDMEII